MLPSFGEILGEPIPAYFTLLMFGYAVAIYSVVRWGKRVGQPTAPLIDAGLASILGGILGGRVLHVLADGYFWDYVHLCTDPSLVAWKITQAQCTRAEGLWDAAAKLCHPQERDCLAALKFYNGGLAYYGGLIGGTASALWVLHRDRMPLLKVMDVTFTGVAMGLFFGRIGCFLGGCCYGIITDQPVGTVFPAWSAASEGQYREGLLAHPGMVSHPVHPTQLYEALGCLLLSVGLSRWSPRRQRFDGQTTLLFLIGYALLRFGIEYLRADDRGGFAGLSTSQWISVLALLACVPAWRLLRQRAERSPA
ncbi:MAG TPA: prolipoprotein diacylglyceryl transferase [Polyangiales bacterium]